MMDAPPRVDTARALLEAGWHPIPLPAGRKGPPPDGTTGTDGADLTLEQLELLSWSGNIAVRAGADQLGLDIDAYAGGLDTLRQLVAELGPLPRTVVSHSGRDDGSGIYWYRVPVGIRFIGGLPGIQTIQRTHRYAVVAPSTHPDHGGTYGWWNQLEAAPCELVPLVEDTPELPWPWIERLSRGTLADGASSAGVAPPEEVELFVLEHTSARATRYLPMVVEHFLEEVARGMSRHDSMTHCLAWSMGEARAGDYPAGDALERLGAAWGNVMDVPRRAALAVPGRATEWQGMVGWSVRRAQALDQALVDGISDDHQGPMLEEEAEPAPDPEEVEQPEVGADDPDDPDLHGADTGDPSDYFNRNGIKALTLARAITAISPMAVGDDRRLYRYRAGVWLPDGERVVARRCTYILGQRVRSSHVSTAMLVLSSLPPTVHAVQPERWVNVRNGLLDWRTGELAEHTPEVRSTYQLAVDWQPAATCPTVDSWMLEVVEADVVPLLWEVIGVAVYARLPFHRAVMLAGTGRNGKGTFLRLIERLVGAEHCAALTLHQIAEDRFMPAGLFGKVVNLAGDIDARAVTATGLFKMLTGEDQVTAQRKHQHDFRFHNQALMVFSANQLPTSSDHTEGYGSRWVVVPFRKLTLGRHGSKPEDHDLEGRLHAELPGVLVRAVEGLRSAMARGGFVMPASVAAETDAFIKASNPLHTFAEDHLEVTGLASDEVSRVGVYSAYQAWCKIAGAGALSARRFWPDLLAAFPGIDTGVTEATPNGYRVGHEQTRVVRGVRLMSAGLWP